LNAIRFVGPPWAWCLLALAASLAGVAHGREDANDLEPAQRLVAAGQLTAAEAAYDRLLEVDPRRLDARLGRGYARAFQHDFDKAQADFRDVLVADGGNVGALSGLGYVLAWSGAYPEAEQQFRRALELAPGQPDALKGLAYVALWRGDAPEAARRFEAIARQAPPSAEVQVGLGQSLLAAGRRHEAREAFARALALEPGRSDARLGLDSARESNVRFDAIAFGGLTDAQGSSKAGLRFAEVGVSPTENVRLFFQFDDTLSLDNVGLARSGLHVPTYYAGGQLTWGRYSTRLEGGWRTLDGGVSQRLVRVEQAAAFSERVALKLGGWVGPREDGRFEASGHAGVAVLVSNQLQLEPTVFYGRSGAPGEHELRGLLAATFRFANGFELGAGVAAGKAISPTPAFEGALGNVYASASAPVGRLLRAHLLVKHDRPQIGPATTAFAVGLSVNFGGRP
jgi:tetratricopeptide (TPR) repeat protein